MKPAGRPAGRRRPDAPAAIDGRPATLADALDRAAGLLGGARLPLVVGRGLDVAAARAALALAERLDGAFDPLDAGAGGALAVLAEAGLLFVTPEEARRRADLVVLVGDLSAATDWLAAVFPARDAPPRAVALLGAGATAGRAIGGGTTTERIAADAARLPALVGALAALVGGRRVDTAALGRPAAGLARLAERLRAARYAVIVWDAATLDALSIETLAATVKTLNLTTRAAALPVPAEAAAAIAAAGWTTGFAPPLRFRAGVPMHAPWAADAARLAAAGEADALVWIGADSPPPALAGLPRVALTTAHDEGAAVSIAVARPGRDHPAVIHDAVAGELVAVAASAPSSDRPTIAAVLDDLRTRIAGEMVPC